MNDYTGTAVLELRAAAADWPAPFTDYVIRGGELQPEDVPESGKAPAAIVVRGDHPIRARRMPVATYPHTIRCYHPDPLKATLLAGLVSDAFHDRGVRVRQTGPKIGAWNSADTGGSGALIEPDTEYPFADVVIEVVAPTVPLA